VTCSCSNVHNFKGIYSTY